MTIPTDHVDEEALERPSHWDIHFIRRFMLAFGPISSLFDFATFGVMLWVFHARPSLFQTGWFVESLATQTLVIFVIRTRRVPFFRSVPSKALLIASLAIGSLLGSRSLDTARPGLRGRPAAAHLLLPDPGRDDRRLPAPGRGGQELVLRERSGWTLPQAPWQHRRIGRLLGRWAPAPH